MLSISFAEIVVEYLYIYMLKVNKYKQPIHLLFTFI